MLDPKLGKIKIFLLLFHLLLEEVLFLVRIPLKDTSDNNYYNNLCTRIHKS